MSGTASRSIDEAIRFLDALYGNAPAASLIELRYRSGLAMRRRFFGVRARALVAAAIFDLSPRRDVYVGVLPRRRPGGGRADLVDEGSVLWADCDTAVAVTSLRRFDPPPSLVISSGSAGHVHAYWLLSQPVPVDDIECENRRLADAIGADMSCADPARILRAPPSLNHKHRPPTPLRIEHCDPYPCWSLREVTGALPELRETRPPGRHAPGSRLDPSGDALLAVPPPVYFERLLGVTVPRHGTIRCPFHDDRTPSLHVYREPERGWYCFGCCQGGTVIDLASLIFGIVPRGSGFITLRRELAERLTSTSGDAASCVNW